MADRLAIAIVILVYILRWLYRRSTKETAFVRTGFLGEKVVVNGGAFVIPVLHEITPVNMNVMRIEVTRRDNGASSPATACASTLSPNSSSASAHPGGRSPPRLRRLGRRTLAGGRHPQPDGGQICFGHAHGGGANDARGDARTAPRLCQPGRDLASEALAANGLELENVAIVDLDQTGLEFFDPSNAFDAEGLTQLTESIETRRKMRNEIEQRTLVDIRNQNLEAQKKVFEIDRETEYARLEQEREVEFRRAVQRAELMKERALREQEAEEAQLASRAGGRNGAACAAARHHPGTHQQRRRDAAPRNRPPPRIDEAELKTRASRPSASRSIST